MLHPPALSSECAILFADLTDSTALYERLGDSDAFKLVKRCLGAMALAVQESGGRVVKTTGDGIMAAFWDADAAAETSIAIQQAWRTLPQLGVAVRIGFHFGPVVESEADIYGDTVNLAARLCELGSPGIAMSTQETALRLNEAWRQLLRPGPLVTLKGISRPIEIVQLLCDPQGELTTLGDVTAVVANRPARSELRLYLNGRAIVLSGEARRVSLGRTPDADVKINDPRASRYHGEIERRGEKFVLIDRSSNGTFVTIEGEREFRLCHEEAVLHGHGWLSFGQSRAKAAEAIEFFCLG